MSIWQFADKLAPVAPSARITLGEGDTPLVRSRRIGPAAGLDALYFKLECLNPSGSYKDRFAVVAISAMLEQGKTCCLATSSGNTGAALAAYCAAAGVRCEIAIVESAPSGKLIQMLTYGARLRRVRQLGTDSEITRQTFQRLQQLAKAPDAAVQISAYHYCPVGMTGVQSIAYELAAQSAAAAIDIAHVFSPSGGGGLTLAVARGYEVLAGRGEFQSVPAIHSVQPAGNDTIAGPLRAGSDRAQDVSCTSKISGLQVASVIDGHDVIAACRKSGGTGHCVTDEDVWNAQAQLAREEGIFSEPAGAVALAGVLRAARAGEIGATEPVVCLVTGTGFKDAASLERIVAEQSCPTIDWTEL